MFGGAYALRNFGTGNFGAENFFFVRPKRGVRRNIFCVCIAKVLYCADGTRTDSFIIFHAPVRAVVAAFKLFFCEVRHFVLNIARIFKKFFSFEPLFVGTIGVPHKGAGRDFVLKFGSFFDHKGIQRQVVGRIKKHLRKPFFEFLIAEQRKACDKVA